MEIYVPCYLRVNQEVFNSDFDGITNGYLIV